jgi:hypothetical protein
MTDIVHYALPFDPLGRMVHKPLVRKKLEEIFDYRFKSVEKIFGS